MGNGLGVIHYKHNVVKQIRFKVKGASGTLGDQLKELIDLGLKCPGKGGAFK